LTESYIFAQFMKFTHLEERKRNTKTHKHTHTDLFRVVQSERSIGERLWERR